MKKIFIAILLTVVCIAFAGCGGGSGYAKGEQFQLGEETYSLEKVVRAPDKDTSSTECYGVSVLQVGSTTPITISGFGTGTPTTKSLIEMTMNDGDTTYEGKTISIAAIDDVDGYAVRMVFYFDIPTGTEMPTSATLKNTDTEETADLDLSGLKPEEETTTTTTSASGLPEGVPIAPDAGNENYDGIGNTDVYDGIGDTDIFNADDTIQDDIAKPGL